MEDLWAVVALGLALFGVSAGLMLLDRNRRRMSRRLREHGVVTTARVILVWSDDPGRSITYRFHAEAQGKSILASADLGELYPEEPKPGEQIQIIYDPERPEHSRPLARKPA
jgi:hypothetical protein